MIRTSKIGSAKAAIYQRNYRRARDRALSRLANAYPETYKELLEQEKLSDETTGGKWVPSDNGSTFIVDILPNSEDTSVPEYEDRSADEGNERAEA